MIFHDICFLEMDDFCRSHVYCFLFGRNVVMSLVVMFCPFFAGGIAPRNTKTKGDALGVSYQSRVPES